jgi:hypothetical protein
LARVREHLVGLGESQVEITSQHRCLGPARRERQGGRARTDRGLEVLAGRRGARPQRLLRGCGEHRRHPRSARTRGEEPTSGGEDVAPAVQLDLGQRPAHLHVRRLRRMRQHRRRDQRHRHAVGGQQAGRTRGFHELVELRRAVTVRQAEERDEDLGLQGRTERAGQEEPADPRSETVHGVAELCEQARRRPARRAEPGAVRTSLLDEGGQQPIDQHR